MSSLKKVIKIQLLYTRILFTFITLYTFLSGFALATRRAGGKVSPKMENFIKDLWISGQETKQKYNVDQAMEAMRKAIDPVTKAPYFEPSEAGFQFVIW